MFLNALIKNIDLKLVQLEKYFITAGKELKLTFTCYGKKVTLIVDILIRSNNFQAI